MEPFAIVLSIMEKERLLYFFDLRKVELDRRISAEDGYKYAELLFRDAQVFYRSGKVRKRTHCNPNDLAFSQSTFGFWRGPSMACKMF